MNERLGNLLRWEIKLSIDIRNSMLTYGYIPNCPTPVGQNLFDPIDDILYSMVTMNLQNFLITQADKSC